MDYNRYAPAKNLTSYIHTYYIWEDLTNVKPLIIESPPSAYGAIVFNLGDVYKAGIYGGKLHTTSDMFFTGQATKSYTLELDGVVSMVGIVLKATSLFHFLGVAQKPFINLRGDATLFLGEGVLGLHKNLKELSSNNEKITLINDFFTDLVIQKNIVRDRFDESIDFIDSVLGNTTLNAVVDRFEFSARYYQKIFQKRIGVSPKTYMRMRRMSHICYLLSTNTEINWQDIVYDMGYFDQSHFIKDFLDFIGRNPSAYFKNNKELNKLLS